jgi:hypothetical protein
MVIDRAVRQQGEIKILMAEHEDILGTIWVTSSDWDLLGKAHAFYNHLPLLRYMQKEISHLYRSLFS